MSIGKADLVTPDVVPGRASAAGVAAVFAGAVSGPATPGKSVQDQARDDMDARDPSILHGVGSGVAPGGESFLDSAARQRLDDRRRESLTIIEGFWLTAINTVALEEFTKREGGLGALAGVLGNLLLMGGGLLLDEAMAGVLVALRSRTPSAALVGADAAKAAEAVRRASNSRIRSEWRHAVQTAKHSALAIVESDDARRAEAKLFFGLMRTAGAQMFEALRTAGSNTATDVALFAQWLALDDLKVQPVLFEDRITDLLAKFRAGHLADLGETVAKEHQELPSLAQPILQEPLNEAGLVNRVVTQRKLVRLRPSGRLVVDRVDVQHGPLGAQQPGTTICGEVTVAPELETIAEQLHMQHWGAAPEERLSW